MTNREEGVGSKSPILVSIVILTYNRTDALRKLLSHLRVALTFGGAEIIVVDNGSDNRTETMIAADFPKVTYCRSGGNIGTGGRNLGLRQSCGKYVITLDDDVVGVDDQDLTVILKMFEARPQLGAVCFKVVDAESGRVINWVHHYPVEQFENKAIVTDEITEGAVVFRRAALDKAGFYPEYFFISHEGPDLAIRIMNSGYDVVYEPQIVVRHSQASEGRESWRNYYFDTRNLFWLVARNYPLLSGLKILIRGVLAMLVYSVRDGFLRYWAKGVIDGLKGLRMAFGDRVVMTRRTREIIRIIDRNRPSFLSMVRKRLFGRQVRI